MQIDELYSDHRIRKFISSSIQFEPTKGPDTSKKRKARKERARMLTKRNMKTN